MTEIPPPRLSSRSEELDYSGDDLEFSYDYEPPLPDTSKYSHLIVEDMEVTSPAKTNLPPAEITSTEGKLWLHCTSSRIFEL